MVPLYEACESLAIRPKTFRQLLADFADLIEGPRPRAGGGQEISTASVELMRRALELRGDGKTPAEIRAVLSELSAREAAATVAEPAAAEPITYGSPAAAEPAPISASPVDDEPSGDWLQKIARLEAEVARSEKRRLEDRDRILTALARAQQEIQHLRFELAAGGTRKQRRKRTFWSRLFR